MDEIWWSETPKLFWMWMLTGAILLGLLSPFYLSYRLLVLNRVRKQLSSGSERILSRLAIVLCLGGLAYTARYLLRFILQYDRTTADGMIEIFEFLVYFAFAFAWLLPVDLAVEFSYRVARKRLAASSGAQLAEQ